MENVTEMVEIVQVVTNKENLSAYDLMEFVSKNGEKALYKLCEAVINTYENIKHIKKFLD